MTKARPTTYWDYIRVEELLRLQSGLAEDDGKITNEEVLFITVHQIYELWFKLVLREIVAARDLFMSEHVEEQELSDVVRSLGRATCVFEVASSHFALLETMTTREYLAFRDKLMPASGFQSAQMRQVEILLGLEDSERIGFSTDGGYLDALRGPDGDDSPALRRVLAQLEDTPTLRDAINDWLRRTPIDGHEWNSPDAEARLDDFIEAFLAAHAKESGASRERALALASTPEEKARMEKLYQQERESVASFLSADGDRKRARIRASMVFIETYRELPLLAWPREVLDALVRFEQAMLIFRQRHARMVERVIGRRTGTGGSAGVAYLDKTALTYRVFDDLWAVRTLQIRREAAPELANAEYYGFRSV